MTGARDSVDSSPEFTISGAGGGSNRNPAKQNKDRASVENIELSLGLSLNGRFGSNPQRSVAKETNNKLFRASSVADFVNSPVDVELSLYPPLTRTCSLPPETEAEWRKRKELQSFRRSEAKRKRVEKLKNGRNLMGLKQSPPSPSPWPSPSPSPEVSLPPLPRRRLPSQGSIGSQESGGSSGVTDLDSQPFSGTHKEASETNEGSELNKVKCNPKIEQDKDHVAYDETMPCVSTKGDGPDGRRIQGFLYKYGKAEEVRIVCVCHGSFLTPAEFVKHGGGGDVDHPLRHILVTSLLR